MSVRMRPIGVLAPEGAKFSWKRTFNRLGRLFTLVRPYRGKAILSAVTLHLRHRDRPRHAVRLQVRDRPRHRAGRSPRARPLDGRCSWSPRCSAGSPRSPRPISSAWVGQRVLADLRRDLFSHIQTLELGYFERNRAGWLISRLTNDVDALEALVTDGLYSSVQNTLLLVGTAGVLFFLDWRLALATLTRLPAHGARDDALPHLVGARLSPHARAALAT